VDSDSNYLFVSKYVDSDTLGNYLKDNFNILVWDTKLQFAIQTADAVLYLHQENIIHHELESIYFY
jgi:serine/threonine protein kinase